MVLSFHPMLVAQKNMICAGRDPGENELAAIRGASAVLLPQGCRESLYKMARQNAPQVFPDYEARFSFPGKTGQARLFEARGARIPRTFGFAGVSEVPAHPGGFLSSRGLAFPLVFKFDWGGESDTTHLVDSEAGLALLLERARSCEATGQKGFVIQEFIPCGGRSLRVVVVGGEVRSYFRVAGEEGARITSLSKGAVVNSEADPEAQAAGREKVSAFCRKAGVDLAGIDLIFAENGDPEPYFLEINYFFGRKGLGGSEAFYRILARAVDGWLAERGLSRASA